MEIFANLPLMKSSLVEVTEQYVVNYLKKNLPPGAIYHSISHTQEVVDAVKNLCKEEKISVEDTECVIIAAWFHDVGFVEGTENHKEYSVSEALDFLKDQELPMDKLEVIVNCIRATSTPVNPQNILEEILCDANLFYLATTNFEENGKLLRAEWEFLHNKVLTDVEWFQCNADFLKEHRYFTNFAFKSWDGMKANNVALTEKKLKNAIQKEHENKLKRKNVNNISFKNEKQIAKNIEITYNVAFKNQIKSSNNLDSKAHVMIALNTLILIVVLTQLFSKTANKESTIIITFLIMIVVFIITLISSIKIIVPSITNGKTPKNENQQISTNILSYEDYHNMSLEDFEEGIQALIQDREFLYSSLNRGLYFSGIQLSSKLKRLRRVYFLFIINVVLLSLIFLLI